MLLPSAPPLPAAPAVAATPAATPVSTSARPTPPPGAAALVNGVAVAADEVQQLVKGLARAEPEPPDSRRIEELTDSALESLIDLELLYQEAVRRNIELGADEVDRQVNELRRHFESQQEFDAALASRGMTTADLRRDTRRTLMAERLLQATAWRDLRVGSEEVERFYEENRAQLSAPLGDLEDSIARMLLDDKKVARRAELVARLRADASIVRLPPYGPGYAEDAAPSAAAAGAGAPDSRTARRTPVTPGGG